MPAGRTPSTEMREAETALSVEDVRSIIHDVEDATAAAIIATGASREELQEAYLYAEGYGDVVDRTGHPLTGHVAQIFEILTAEEPPDRDR